MAVKRPYAPVRAEMSGQVVAINVENGQHVNEGDSVLTMEAMKMFMDIEAPLAGEVEIMVGLNTIVNKGDVVAKIYP